MHVHRPCHIKLNKDHVFGSGVVEGAVHSDARHLTRTQECTCNYCCVRAAKIDADTYALMSSDFLIFLIFNILTYITHIHTYI